MSPRFLIPVLVTVFVGLGLPSPTQTTVSARQAVVAGTFHAIYGDGIPELGGGPPQRRYTLSSGNLHWRLTVTDAVLKTAGGAQFLNGKTVEVTGTEPTVGTIEVATIRLAGESATLAAPLENPVMAIAGSQQFRTILCKFADVAAEPQNLAFFDNLMSDTKPGANHYWKELSYDFINLDGSTQHNWQTMAHNRAEYFENDDVNDDIQLGELATDCAAAHDATVDFSAAHGINFIFNASIGCCAWGGGVGLTLDGKNGFSATWMPPGAWGTTSHGVLGQEMGHSFGLPHEGCFGTESPYDSQWDVQSAARQVHTNADYKDKLGWLHADQKYTATTDPNQIIEIRRLALPELAPHANSYLMATIPLPAPAPASQYYTVEVRKFAGYDQSPQSVPLEGVLIHFVDTTLSDKRAQVVGTPCNGAGAQWVPGELFQDEANGITIAVLSETSDGFEIAINPDSDVTVSKTATPNPAVAGELLTYTITVRNLGPGPATGIVVKDTLPAGTTYDENTLGPGLCTAVLQVVTCTVPGSLAVGASKTFSIIARVSPSLANNSTGTTTITNLVNVVAAQDTDPTATNNNFSLTTLVVTEADLRVGKECKPDSPAPTGSTGTCTVTVDNLGPSDAFNVVLTDTHVSSGSFTITSATASPGGPCGVAGGVVTCNLGIEPVGGRTTISVNVTSNEPVDVNDTACVASSTPDPDYDNDCASDGVSFFSKADLSLTKTGPAGVVAGETITHTISVMNGGPSIATGVVVRDNLPADVTMVSASIALPAVGQCIPGTPGNPALPLTCSIGNLANGGTAVITVVSRVKSGTPNGTILSNGAYVAGTSSDPDNSNNSQSALTAVTAQADLSIVKTADAATYKPNTPITYRITTRNNGSSDAQNVTVVDTLPDIKQAVYLSNTNPGGCIFQAPKSLTCNLGTMPAGSTQEFFVMMTVKGGQGPITNSVIVSSTTTDPVAGNNSSSVAVTVKGGK
jgi:uncharacterized repeat protein (TIGR01451 family)/M6 family metalloprotease-like protein